MKMVIYSIEICITPYLSVIFHLAVLGTQIVAGLTLVRKINKCVSLFYVVLRHLNICSLGLAVFNTLKYQPSWRFQ